MSSLFSDPRFFFFAGGRVGFRPKTTRRNSRNSSEFPEFSIKNSRRSRPRGTDSRGLSVSCGGKVDEKQRINL